MEPRESAVRRRRPTAPSVEGSAPLPARRAGPPNGMRRAGGGRVKPV